jgi:hypothetical protein
MNDHGWDNLVDALDSKFGLSDHGRYTEPLEDNPELTQTVRFVCFVKDGKTYKAERVEAPAIVDRKSHYHKAAGSGVRFENIYDPDQTSYKIRFFIKNGDEWENIEPQELAL